MRHWGTALLVGMLLAGVAGCKKSGIKTEMKELTYGRMKIKGKLPVGWAKGVMSALALKEEAEGMQGMTTAAISFDAYGGTGYTKAKMKAEIQRRKKNALRAWGGEKPAVVEDLKEARPGVWTLVTKRELSAFKGKHGYRVYAFHLPQQGTNMFICRARSRLKRAGLWKQLKEICAGLTFSM